MAAISTVALATIAAAAVGSAGYGIAKQQEAMHKKNDEDHRLQVEKEALNSQKASLEANARAEADAKLAEKRSRSGRAAAIATSPLGVTDTAPIARASLEGRSLLG